MQNWLILILFLVLLPNPSLAEPIVVPLNGHLSGLDIWPSSEFLVDAQGQNQLKEAQQRQDWNSTQNHSPSFAYVEGALWIRTKILNPARERQHLLLDHGYALTDEIHVYLIAADGSLQSMVGGDRVQAKGAVADARNPAFDLQIPIGESELYIKVQSRALVSGKFDLWSPLTYFNRVNRELVMVSVLLGALAILVLYNAFLYFTLKSKVYLHYVAYLLMFLSIQIVFSGVSRIYLSHSSNPFLIWYWNEGVHQAIKLSEAFACTFAIHFLNLETYKPTFARVLRITSWFMIGSLVVGMILPYRLDSVLVVVLTILTTMLLLAIGIWAAMRGYRPAYYYIAGWAMVLIATTVVALRTTGVFPINLFTTWAQLGGATIEGLVLSLALGERYNFLQARAAADRENSISKLVEKEASKTHSYSQLEKIIYPHQLDLIKQGLVLEQTMPSGQSEACVLALDTINSSKIDRQKARGFLNAAFASCYREMLMGYNKERMTASAYRLKEVGDGFFCSIGFPFHTPDGENPAELAFRLALKFSKGFYQQAMAHGFAKPPQASIAIAFGEVEAYYPTGGVLEYNMFGRGIILSDRYEKLRKTALQHLIFTGNLLVLDYRVYAMLSEATQELLQRFDVPSASPIRDDEEATHFYFCIINENISEKLAQSA